LLHILTLNWNGKEKLKELYPSLIKSLSNIDYHWYIRDHNSNDGSQLLNDEWQNDKVSIIRYHTNKENFSQGCTWLFNEAKPSPDDYVMLLNNDVVFNDTTSISNMISLFEKDADIGVVGARLLYKDTNKLQHAGVIFVPGYKTPTHFRAHEVADDLSKQNREFQAITGAVLITKAKYFQMDSNLIWAFDDVDMCMTIKFDMHKKIVYCGNTNIFHEESASLKKNPVNKMFLKHNLQYFLTKWKDRYQIDQEAYITNPKHNLYIGPNK
jgi:GT2 family glycosyltransferase